jgi:hypothetical protein
VLFGRNARAVVTFRDDLVGRRIAVRAVLQTFGDGGVRVEKSEALVGGCDKEEKKREREREKERERERKRENYIEINGKAKEKKKRE